LKRGTEEEEELGTAEVMSFNSMHLKSISCLIRRSTFFGKRHDFMASGQFLVIFTRKIIVLKDCMIFITKVSLSYMISFFCPSWEENNFFKESLTNYY
jgi:hypothetical protein